jgi:hypothetical protein
MMTSPNVTRVVFQARQISASTSIVHCETQSMLNTRSRESETKNSDTVSKFILYSNFNDKGASIQTLTLL